MDMNKKGQLAIMKIMIGIIVLIMVIIMIPATKESITVGTNTSSNLNCTSDASIDTLSTANKATCIVTDFLMFYMIGIAISAGMAYMAGRKALSGTITAIVTFVITSILILPLKDLITYARDATHLNCSSSAISVASRLSCLMIDVWLFWFIVTALSAAISFIFVKKVVSKL